MLLFSLLMLGLALMAYFRGPIFNLFCVPWFFISWLPSELPWLFAIIQTVVLAFFFPHFSATNSSHILSLCISLVTFLFWYRLHKMTLTAQGTFQDALRKGLGENYEKELSTRLAITSSSVFHHRDWMKPFSFKRNGVERLQDISYGATPRHILDIYRPTKSDDGKIARPVLLHLHGGAWVVGHKYQQAQPLINYLVQQGWICVDINYRLAPVNRLPDALVDVKTAIAWLKKNIAAYGGDPKFIAITGGSAGGHLATLAALTAQQPEFQPGFEEVDTSVQAVVPAYGVYDFTNYQRESILIHKRMEKILMPANYLGKKPFWESLSPLFQISDAAPPMFIIHGTNDCLVPVEQVRNFVASLREKSKAPVVYAELKGAQHGFEIFHAVRTEFHIEAVGKFLHYCYGKYLNK